MKYKYKFSPLMYVLFIVGLILAVVCMVANIIRLATALPNDIEFGIYDLISIILCVVLPIPLMAFLIAATISSNYALTDKCLIVRFGFIREKYQIDQISKIIKNLTTNKLSIVFLDESFYTVVISPSDYENFSSELITKNKNIEYGETTADK